MRTFLAVTCALLLLSGCSGDESDGDEFARDSCKISCQQVNGGGRGCIAATTLAECQDACLRETTAKAEQFKSCVDTNRLSGIFTDDGSDASCPERECLSILIVDAQAPNAATETPPAACKANCDAIEQDCPEETDAGVTSDCKAACDSSSVDAVESFSSCSGNNRYICSDLIPCYDHLGVFL